MALDFPASPTTGQTFSSGGQTWTYNGSGWASSYQSSGVTRQQFTATAGQTSFTVTGGYLANLVDVYQNGVKLVNGTDVTVTSGTTVNLAVGATTGDVIEVIGIAAFAVANYLPLAGGTLSGALTMAGAGANFNGDFTNATVLNRNSFKTSTTNGSTGIYALPNGTSTAASWQATNAADPTNASKILIATNGSTDVQLVSGINGTGTYLPLSFYTNGTQQMQLSTAGILTGTAGNLMLVQGNSQASTSGTSIPFTGIPSWVKRITVNISGVSTSGTANLRFRIGPVAGVELSGYLGSSTGFAATTLASVQFTAGFDVNDGGTAATVRNGSFVFSLLDAATNTWSVFGIQGQSNTNSAGFIGGSKALAGPLSVLSMTTTNGTDTFDAGTINIQYE